MNNLYKKYQENEDSNFHSENAVLLAENFGSRDDLIITKTIQLLHKQLGYIPYEFSKIRDSISSRLYPKLQEAK